MSLLLFSIMDGGDIMTIEKIVEYVLHTPLNTNKAILIAMLEQLIVDHNGSLAPGEPDHPDYPDSDSVIYDGGLESWF